MNTCNLYEKSKSYYAEADVYDRFSQCEDAPGLILKRLVPRVRGKRLLDLGCGSGKYAALLAPHAESVVGVDASEQQLANARKRSAHLPNVSLVRAPAGATGLPARSFDMVLASWVFCTILDEERRLRAIREAERVLTPGGQIILVENDEGGEFEEIRSRVDDPLERTRKYNDWLVESVGFSVEEKIETYFDFGSTEEAKRLAQV